MATHQLDDSLIPPPQDERYLNYYFYKMANDSGVNIRMLGPSYLYPFNNKGFPEHVANFSRPIIVHGTAKPGKMIKGEAELQVAENKQCFDLGVLPKEGVGTYGCHSKEQRGGSQGIIWLDNRLRVAYGLSDREKVCLDGTDAQEGGMVRQVKCADGREGQLWDYDDASGRMRNRASGLCLDPMRFDRERYPEAAKDPKWPVSMQPCGSSRFQRLAITMITVEEALKAMEEKSGH